MRNARLKPLAKKPPKGAMIDANKLNTTAYPWNAEAQNEVGNPSCLGKEKESKRERPKHNLNFF